MIPYSKQGYKLFHDGAIALAEVEANGMRIDTDYLDSAIKKTDRRINRLKRSLDKSEVMKVWRKAYRSKTNINSGDQLGRVLFEIMGFESPGLTAGKKHKTDLKSLSTVDNPFIRKYLKMSQLQKASGTFLGGIKRQVVDGLIHPCFNLHIPRSFRSSSNDPNFQNFPVRNEKIGRLVRLCFIARKGRVLVEIDYSGIEVCIAACYHLDPTMIDYIEDPASDMHRDMAMECYLLEESEVTKQIRYCAKNKFVFPQFYGDWYIACAKHLWEAIDEMGLKTVSGKPLKKHLREQGITKLGALDPSEKPERGSFERHIQKVEQRFWGERFPVYTQWKREWFADYQENGWILTKTGFICQGHMPKKKVINYPIQGSAFHCLLWSMNQLVLKDLKRRKMKTKMVGQIHDSTVADVPVEELEDYLALSYKVMVTRLKKRWPWIIVPLEIEAEVSPVGGSWADKKEVKIHA